jgi:hypothetical protein
MSDKMLDVATAVIIAFALLAMILHGLDALIY